MSKAKLFSNVHRKLSWVAGAGILIWCISGVMHPIMSWYGPSAVTFYPPAVKLDAAQARELLSNFSIKPADSKISIAKIVPSQVGPVLQLNSDESQTRRYITSNKINYSDEQQARWLAAHYSGKKIEEIKTVEKINAFNDSYPAVNRLLPVYKVNFQSSDNLVLYVHTETMALASISNDWKNTVRSIFQVLHTFNWLDSIEFARVIIISMMMISLLVFSYSGLRLVYLFKARKIKQVSRNIHRKLAYFLWLPLLLWSFSGFYHLLQSSFINEAYDTRISKTLNFNNTTYLDSSWLNDIKENILAVSIVNFEDKLYFRVALELQQKNKTEPNRQSRFRGRVKVGRVLFVDASSGRIEESLNDNEMASYTLLQAVDGLDKQSISTEPVRRFGPDYDFRNKRLPVIKLSANDDAGNAYFFDPATGLLIDQTSRVSRMERYSFTFLHKWNFLRPLTGAPTRDLLIVVCIVLILISTIMGFKMLLAGRGRI